MSTETEPRENDASRYALDIVQGLHDLDAAIEAYGSLDPVYGDNAQADPFGRWLNDALEVVVYVAVTDPEPREARAIVEVLVTFGGPNCWVRRDVEHGESVEVVTTWWNDRDTRRAWCPNLSTALDDLADAYRGGRS